VTFDPFKSSIATTDVKKTVQPKPTSVDTYDPTAVQSEIKKLKDERMVSGIGNTRIENTQDS
jgi:hypothetical protein